MKRDAGKLTARQRLALLTIAAEPTIDGAAEKIGVTRKTVYEWLKQEPFKQAVEEARREHVESSFRTLRHASKKAADKLSSISTAAMSAYRLRLARKWWSWPASLWTWKTTRSGFRKWRGDLHRRAAGREWCMNDEAKRETHPKT